MQTNIIPIGTIIHSMLTETQIQLVYGKSWVLMDGRNVAGSSYAAITGNNIIPDARGLFLRGKNNGSSRNPDGDIALGTYTADKYASHSHGVSWSGANGTTLSGSNVARGDSASGTFSNSVNASGGNETASKSMTVNIFIKIN